MTMGNLRIYIYAIFNQLNDMTFVLIFICHLRVTYSSFILEKKGKVGGMKISNFLADWCSNIKFNHSLLEKH